MLVSRVSAQTYIHAPHCVVWPTSRAFTVAFQIWLMVTRYDKDKTFPFTLFRETFYVQLNVVISSAKYWRSQWKFSFIIFWNNIRECLKLRWRKTAPGTNIFECKVWQCKYTLVFYILQLGNWPEFVFVFLYWKQTLFQEVCQLLVNYT